MSTPTSTPVAESDGPARCLAALRQFHRIKFAPDVTGRTVVRLLADDVDVLRGMADLFCRAFNDKYGFRNDLTQLTQFECIRLPGSAHGSLYACAPESIDYNTLISSPSDRDIVLAIGGTTVRDNDDFVIDLSSVAWSDFVGLLVSEFFEDETRAGIEALMHAHPDFRASCKEIAKFCAHFGTRDNEDNVVADFRDLLVLPYSKRQNADSK